MWDSRHLLPFNPAKRLRIQVYDHDDGSFNSDDYIGKASIPLYDLILGAEVKHTLTLRAGPRVLNPIEEENLGQVELSLKCIDGRSYENNIIKVHLIRGRNFQAMDWGGKSDPFV